MNTYDITKNDIKERIYFITKLVQNQKGTTMQGALTSKSDSMGGIFDRFINTLSDTLVFNKIILKQADFAKIGKNITAVEDFYYYKPNEKSAGIAPDIFGVSVDGNIYPFTKFDNKWIPVKGTPQIEVKTFKAKDQMISLRNQHYDNKYLVLVDLDLRIDYLVPFLDRMYLNQEILNGMQMNDNIFIINDEKGLIEKVSPIDFENDIIGNIRLISITNASDFMKLATECEGETSVLRMKEIKKLKVKYKNNLIHVKLKSYAKNSSRVSRLYEFNNKWIEKFKLTGQKIKLLDFSAEKIEAIEIIKFNKDGIVIQAKENNCSFNGELLDKEQQYSIKFAILDRTNNHGKEFFMQKQCAYYLTSLEKQLTDEIINIIS